MFRFFRCEVAEEERDGTELTPASSKGVPFRGDSEEHSVEAALRVELRQTWPDSWGTSALRLLRTCISES